MQVTLGGDRLGSGNKNKIALKDYNRSTHDLTQKFTSSLQVGTLYPFLCIPAMRGDKFDINLEADARTIPTKGPLFGSFKMQVDLFQCDVRLYQAILHNNPLAIGLKMNQVKFPQLYITDDKYGNAFANNSLLKYLGMSGLGHSASAGNITCTRAINAIPALAYYEIFKTYYSNKQEENAYVIGTERIEGDVEEFAISVNGTEAEYGDEIMLTTPTTIKINVNNNPLTGWEDNVYIQLLNLDGTQLTDASFKTWQNFEQGGQKIFKKIGQNEYAFTQIPILPTTTQPRYLVIHTRENQVIYYQEIRGLEPFKLANIDEMRLKLLSHHQLGTPFNITNTELDAAGTWDKASGADSDGMPYIKLVDVAEMEDGTEKSANVLPMNGLVVKTYQSDLYNNWVNTEWIDGENGIAAVTAISTSGGSVKIDAINLAEKLYNMLNRIAVSDGSYEGWQDAVYTQTPRRHIESPIYLGGMSSEIMFEEIVQQSQGDEENPLGTLGGKGKLFKNKGGHVSVKCNEACFIIGIVSLTPRINYCQGNEFYLTDLKSMDDFHKPALDGIGFQNLIAERMAWWDTSLSGDGNVSYRHSIGKLPAWIEYMTAVDKCYGDFAETEGKGFMTLLRDYTRDGNEIQDATTYIDPRKYNYAFAVTDIDAQNFWVQIKSNITARRLMSAKQIPNI